MDFKNGQELLKLCEQEQCSVSEIMKRREVSNGEMTMEQIEERMRKSLSIMKDSVQKSISSPHRSMSGLIGGEARKITDYGKREDSLGGSLMNKMIAYSMAVLEMNASMGVIVAAPTAGSSGVLPGVLLSLQEEKNWTNEQVCAGLFHASAIGYLLMRNASVAGAEAGCQAEVGAASAMAAGAVVEIMGGTPEMSLQAASMALSNLLGLVCDPVAGLVEIPCQSRNAMGAANALTCAEVILSGVQMQIPFDEMAEAMYKVGRRLPYELRETALGGCAATPTGCRMKCR